MGAFSILPSHLSGVEIWVGRIFLLLALITFGPWVLVLAYDLLLYVWRSAEYEFPVLGGRARGHQRPRAPTLKERPDGHRRQFSLAKKTQRKLDQGHRLIISDSKRTTHETGARAPYEHNKESR
ncbi:Hypothetical protein R9X50_00219800 [Acrodontium crateriforme]|uniref:Uncharacterized protein n=1 Tax=Acrodontium crateriforme TaxID=150365 RepID=A0AAQ3R8S5_9PEZI|nr:Hypothetical protein R9X50_00219800 [Acrodontium crateriforme]